MPHADRRYDDFLLVLRAFAGMYVVVFHVFISGIFDGAQLENLIRIGPLNLSWLLTGSGQAGVYMFFVLSGYLMGKGFANGRYVPNLSGTRAFYWARFLRIYPMLAFFMLMMITLGRTNAPTAAETASIVARMLVLTQWNIAWSLWFPWFGHLWSVLTEIQFYLCAPVIAWVIGRVAARRATAFAILAVVIMIGVCTRTLLWASFSPHTAPLESVLAAWNSTVRQPLYVNLDLFIAGMLLNRVATTKELEPKPLRVVLFFGAIAAFFALCAFLTHYALFSPWLAARDAWAVALPTLCILFMLVAITIAERFNAHRGPLSSNSGSLRGIVGGFAYCGTLTYGIYLWHLPFIALPIPFSRPFSAPANAVVTILLTYGLSIIMAQVVHVGIEERFDRFRRSLRTSIPYQAAHRKAAFREPAT